MMLNMNAHPHDERLIIPGLIKTLPKRVHLSQYSENKHSPVRDSHQCDSPKRKFLSASHKWFLMANALLRELPGNGIT